MHMFVPVRADRPDRSSRYLIMNSSQAVPEIRDISIYTLEVFFTGQGSYLQSLHLNMRLQGFVHLVKDEEL